jgi:hypothetical protein
MSILSCTHTNGCTHACAQVHGHLQTSNVLLRDKHPLMHIILSCTCMTRTHGHCTHACAQVHGDLKTSNVLLRSAPGSDLDPRGYEAKVRSGAAIFYNILINVP